VEPLDLELAKAARTLVVEKTLLGLEGEEHLLILADTETDEKVVWATARAAHVVGAKVAIISFAAPADVGEKAIVPRPVVAAMENSDVMLELSKRYLLFSKAWKQATEKGTRYLGLWGMDRKMMVRLIGKVNWSVMIELGKALQEISESATTMEIKAQAGTDLSFELSPERPFIRSETEGGLGGEIAWAPLEKTICGRAVLDGSIYPPEIGRIHTPIELNIDEGKIIGVEGGTDATVLEKWLASWKDPRMYNIAHFSYGFNPGAIPSDRILEADRVFGSIVIGLGYQRDIYRGNAGVAASHSDGTIMNPSIIIDGECIEENGAYVHPRLVRIVNQLFE
jgi:leucyl aminopeptidase (aminopeptidase T)